MHILIASFQGKPVPECLTIVDLAAARDDGGGGQFFTLHDKLSGTVYCTRSCLFVCLFVGLLPRKLEIVHIDLHQTGSVGESSDHLQPIKFWSSCDPGKGVCGGAKFLAPPYYSQRAVFVSPPSAFFIYR